MTLFYSIESVCLLIFKFCLLIINRFADFFNSWYAPECGQRLIWIESINRIIDIIHNIFIFNYVWKHSQFIITPIFKQKSIAKSKPIGIPRKENAKRQDRRIITHRALYAKILQNFRENYQNHCPFQIQNYHPSLD